MSSKSVLISVAFAWSLLSANVGLGQALPGGVVGPPLMLDATAEIHLNEQANNSPGSTYVPRLARTQPLLSLLRPKRKLSPVRACEKVK